MKPSPKPIEGPEATKRFDTLVRKVLSVSHDELVRREKEYQRQAKQNPNRRGPKPKHIDLNPVYIDPETGESVGPEHPNLTSRRAKPRSGKKA